MFQKAAAASWRAIRTGRVRGGGAGRAAPSGRRRQVPW